MISKHTGTARLMTIDPLNWLSCNHKDNYDYIFSYKQYTPTFYTHIHFVLKYASVPLKNFVFLVKNESKLLANYIFEAWNIRKSELMVRN